MRRIQYIAVMVCLLSTAVWMSWWGSYSPALNQVDSLFAASRFQRRGISLIVFIAA